MVVDIHEENNFIAGSLPVKELINEISFEESMRRDVAKTVATNVASMLRPNSVPASLVIPPNAPRWFDWSIS
jgi:hypothetical protein